MDSTQNTQNEKIKTQNIKDIKDIKDMNYQKEIQLIKDRLFDAGRMSRNKQAAEMIRKACKAVHRLERSLAGDRAPELFNTEDYKNGGM